MVFYKVSYLLILFMSLLFIKEIHCQEFLDLIKVPFRDFYFVVLNTGLYLYNFYNFDCSLLYEFDPSIYINDGDSIYLSELEYESNSFIFCLINEYLFLFNTQNNGTYIYKINDINFINDKYINILPYKFEYNNISFIIACISQSTIINFYYYNFKLKKGINEPKKISFNNINIKNNLVRCLLKPLLSKIFCYFYYVDTDYLNYISLATYLIEDMNINSDNIFNSQINDNMIEMKLVSSYNNKFLLGVLISSESMFHCFINNGESNIFEEKETFLGINTKDSYKIFYFNSTGVFIVISGPNQNLTSINAFDYSMEHVNFDFEIDFIFSLIYYYEENDGSDNYYIINTETIALFGECYETKILFEFKNSYYYECPNEISYKSENIPYFCEVKCSQEKPLEQVESQNCQDFCGINDMGEKMCITKYKEQDNSNLILNNIKKDILTTNFDKINLYNDKQSIIIEEKYNKFIITTNEIIKEENDNFINLGECENILSVNYQITDIDKLIILIIEIKEENSPNYKKVFEVYSELNNDKFLSRLDLNLCNNINNNEISKCSNYSIESLFQDLCISCFDSFYPIFDDINNENSFIKCYNNPKGYYLDENKFYQKCYSSCEYCINNGDDINHNCTKCKKDFSYELHFNSINSINCYKKCDFNSYYNETSHKYYCTFNSLCPDEYNKIIPEKNICTNKCDKDPDYRYEFRHTCYKQCPDEISIKSNKKFYCEAICTKELPFEIISTQICVDICTMSQINKGLCKLNYESKEELTKEKDDKELEDKILKNFQEEIKDSFNKSDLDEGEKITIQLKDSTVTLDTSENQKKESNQNISTIDLGECENKIKDEYNISRNKSLLIFKLDINQNGYKIPKIEYEVYYPLFNDKLIKLNLTVCKDIKINLNIPLFINNENIDKFNSSSAYYNDICYVTTSENGTDISLKDRKKNFVNNNLSVCEEDCTFVEYKRGKVICSCKVKSDSIIKVTGMVIDKDKLLSNFVNFNNIANIQILKCYKLFFKLEAFKNNYGNIFILIIIFFLLLTIIIFYLKDLINLREYFYKILFLKKNSKKVNKIIKQKIKEEERLNMQKIIVENINNNSKNIGNNIDNNINNDDNNINNANNNNINNANIVINEIKRRKNSKGAEKGANYQNKNLKGIIIPPPVYLIYKQAIKEMSKANPNKKKLKKNKRDKKENDNQNNMITINDNNNNSNRVSDNNLTLDLGNKIIKLNENEIFKMALEINSLTITELNDLKYKDAFKKDSRTFCLYYLSLIKMNHILYFSFVPFLDFNSRIIKIFRFFFNFSVNFTVNALFFNDASMHKIYEEGGTFDFIYNLPQIIYSAIISGIIDFFIKLLALSESNFIKLKNYKYKEEKELITEAQKIWCKIKTKFAFLFIILLGLLVLFWFYLACFCAVYNNTQIHLIKDTVISFSTSMIYPIFIYLIPSILRINSLNSKNRQYMYNLSKLFQML